MNFKSHYNRAGHLRSHKLLASFLLLASFCAGVGADAQTTNASLSGTINDTSGAAIPGAQVTARNSGTGLTSTIVSSDSGTYTLPNLPPGTYTLTVTKDGFTTSVQNNVVLSVSESATLKATMAVGATSETITVDASATLINQSTAEVSTLVDENAIKQLPLNGRDPSSLVLLAPGTTNVLNRGGKLQAVNSIPTETGASANGGRQGSTYYLLDGVQNMDTYLLLDAPFPNADATQEFRVITNNYDARYGFAPGAVVTIQTKSGTMLSTAVSLSSFATTISMPATTLLMRWIRSSAINLELLSAARSRRTSSFSL